MEMENQMSAGAAKRVLAEKWDGRTTLTVSEAGEVLGLSRQAAYAAAQAGNIPALRIGRRIIVPRVALERLLTSV